jgi:hypothetical protein
MPSGRTALGDALAWGCCAAALQLWEAAQQEPDCEAILAAAVTAASPYLNNRRGFTPLSTAAEQGYHQLVPLLVTPANLNLPRDIGRLIPLHLAFKNNHIKVAEALLDAGAAVSIPDSIGRIPLAFAVQRSNTHLNVRLLQLMKQQQPAADEATLMEPLITAAAWLSKKVRHARSAARLFAAVMDAWGPSAAADLLQGLLKHLGPTPHYLAEAMLVGWRQAQRPQLPTHTLLSNLQRLVLDPLASSRLQQHQMDPQDRALRLRLPLALLLSQPAPVQGQGAQGPQDRGPAEASLAAHMAGLSLGISSSQIAAAAQRGSLQEVAALLAAVPDEQQPHALLEAAQAAGSRGHTYVCNAALQQFAALDWQAAACTNQVAPLACVIRAAVMPSAPPPPSTTTSAAAASNGGSGQQPFCLYWALLDSWAAVEHMLGLELAATVVEAVEAGTAQADGEA